MKYSLLTLIALFSFSFTLCQNKADLFQHQERKQQNSVSVQKIDIGADTTFEKIVIEGHDSKVPFYYYSNTRIKNPPHILLLHGLGDSKEDWIYPSEPYLDWSKNTTAIKDSLLLLGYNIIIPDAKFHGERSYELDFRPPEFLPPVLSKNTADTQLFENLMTGTIKDLRIIMDYIEAKHSDKDHDFGVVGYSMGGNLAILLSIFDSRISSVAACVPPINLPATGLEQFDWSDEIIQGQINITPMTHVRDQKAPIIMLMGKNDYFSPEEDVSKFYNGISITDKELKYFDAGHILPNDYRLDVIRWITTHTGIKK